MLLNILPLICLHTVKWLVSWCFTVYHLYSSLSSGSCIYIYIYTYMCVCVCVTLRWGCAKQTIFLFVLAWNQTKAWARDLDTTGSGQGNAGQRGVGTRNSEKAVGEGRRRGAVDNGQQKEVVREGQSGWVGIPSSFVETSLEIHASVSLQMHREFRVTEPPSFTLSWPKPLLFVWNVWYPYRNH